MDYMILGNKESQIEQSKLELVHPEIFRSYSNNAKFSEKIKFLVNP